MIGIVKNTFRPQKTLKTTRMKLYNTLTFPASLYSSENFTIKARDARRITASEMKYVRKTAGYTWTDYKTNTKIAKELNITPVLDKTQDYRKNWIRNVKGMSRKRLTRIIKNYRPKDTRNHGRPFKRLLEV